MFQGSLVPPSVVMLHSEHRKVQHSTPATIVVRVGRYVVSGVREVLAVVNSMVYTKPLQN